MKKKTIFFSSLLFFLLLSGSCFFLFTPHLVDSYLLPTTTKNLPFSDSKISLSRISPWKIRGTATFADNGRDVLSLPKIEFNYTPKSLLDGEIQEIIIDGATFHLPLNTGAQQTTKKSENKKSSLILPVAFNRLILKNSSIIIHHQGRQHQLLLNSTLLANFTKGKGRQKQFLSAQIKLSATGAIPLSCTIEIDTNDDGYKVSFTAAIPDIKSLSRILPDIAQYEPAGEMNIEGEFVTDNLAQIANFAATAKLSQYRLVMGNLILADQDSDKPLLLTMKGDREIISAELGQIQILAPQKGSLTLQGHYSLTDNAFQGVGEVLAQSITSPISFAYAGNKSGAKTSVNFTASSEILLLGEGSPVAVSPLKVGGSFTLEAGTTSGTITVSTDRITHPASKTDVRKIALSLPLRFPLDAQTEPGIFTINEIQYDGVTSGSFKAKLNLHPEGIKFSSNLTSEYGPDLKIDCSGAITTQLETSVSCELPETSFDSMFFPSYVELPTELSANGNISAKLSFTNSPTGTKGDLQLKISDATVDMSENIFSEINTTIHFPNFPLPHSNPSQLCTIGKLQLGNIELTDAHVRFRLEDYQSIFIEKTGFHWCRGKVESGSFRLTTAKQELTTTLYCDRLNFSELLSQLGIDDTEGAGSLNGRLPISLGSHGISFDDGFLFSTPGDSGIVHFNNTTQLRQGMPGIDQTPYLDYSMQALENFSYNWTKLTFNSEDENLLIKMQIDGKPAEPLPFGYRKGNIVPTDKGPGLQHPIKLDVNFRLPLTDLFQYGKNIQSIMENM